MIPEIKKILYATDLSESAQYAFGYAVSLSNRYQARLTVLHVIEELSATVQIQVKSMIGDEKWLLAQEEITRTATAKIEARLKKICTDAQTLEDHCTFGTPEIVIAHGHPVQTILEQSTQHNSDLIVMGTHGFGTFKDTWMGSTARRVLHRSRTPVLTIRLPN